MTDPDRPPDPRPPLGSWARVYALVLAFLALQIVLYALLTRAFS